MSKEPARFLPLKPVVFHILLALADEHRHGYGVIRTVRERTRGQIQLQTGPLYRHLKRLLAEGLIKESDARAISDDPRRTSCYRLSTLGRNVLKLEARRLEDLVSTSRSLGVLGNV